jgi:hypothetical protein
MQIIWIKFQVFNKKVFSHKILIPIKLVKIIKIKRIYLNKMKSQIRY